MFGKFIYLPISEPKTVQKLNPISSKFPLVNKKFYDPKSLIDHDKYKQAVTRKMPK